MTSHTVCKKLVLYQEVRIRVHTPLKPQNIFIATKHIHFKNILCPFLFFFCLQKYFSGLRRLLIAQKHQQQRLPRPPKAAAPRWLLLSNRKQHITAAITFSLSFRSDDVDDFVDLSSSRSFQALVFLFIFFNV